MGKQRRSYPKSANTSSRLKLNFSLDPTIYKKIIEFEGKPFEFRMNIKPHKPSEPTIKMHERK